jgi:GxxExxY protein
MGIEPFVRKIIPKGWSDLTQQIIAAAIEVHSHLGPGRLEKNYEEAMCVELRLRGLRFERQRRIRALYKGHDIGEFQLDLVVEALIVVELKAIERIAPVPLAQLVSCLRTIDLSLGLLINFNHARLIDGVSRRLNPVCSLIQALPDSSPSSSHLSHFSEFHPEDDE